MNHDRAKLLGGLLLAAVAGPAAAQAVPFERADSALSSSQVLNLAVARDLPDVLRDMPFVAASKAGQVYEVQRTARIALASEEIAMPTVKPEAELLRSKLDGEVVPALDDANDYETELEFFDARSKRTFRYRVNRLELARASRAVSASLEENGGLTAAVRDDTLDRESEVRKSWSNATDNRIRRSIADGWSDNNWVYQNLADYGGCSATVLSATSTRMIALTAAHCIYSAGGAYVYTSIRPRRNGGTSPTWGSWKPTGFGYYPSFLDNDCEDNWDGSVCIKHDIALVIAAPEAGAKPPSGMGWGYRPKSFLDSHSKYRRGYPGCGYGHSPSGCTTNNLYGDGALSVGSFTDLDADDWNRRIKFSSDVNPGDSGSGLYYYRDGNPYVFAVTSAEDTCYQNCSSSRPNHARRITPQWFDFINNVVF